MCLSGRLLAGVDEVGRGPLIGAVVTAAVILDPDRPIVGLADSKKLTEKNVTLSMMKSSNTQPLGLWAAVRPMRLTRSTSTKPQ